MAEESTTTIFATTTITSTKTLTRTILSLTPFSSALVSTPTSVSSNIVLTDSSRNQTHHSSLYPYPPSLALAIIFTILYFFVTIYHGYLSIYLPSRPETLKKHRYTIPLWMAGLVSTISYLLRSISIQPQHTSNIALYTISTTLILTSPMLTCVTLYLLLTRLITRCLPSTIVPTPTTPRNPTTTTSTPNTKPRSNPQRLLFLTPTLLNTLLLTSLTITIILLVTGTILRTLPSQIHQHQPQSNHILLTSHTLTLLTYLIYLTTVHLFCIRVRNNASTGFNPLIMKIVIAAWIASGFVFLSLTYHVVVAVATALGIRAGTVDPEWTLYVFDGVPVLAALVVLGWWHPVRWVQERVLSQARPGARAVELKVRENQGVAKRGEGVKSVRGAGQGQGQNGHVRRRSRVGFAFAF